MMTTRTRTLAFIFAATFTMLVAAPAANASDINVSILRTVTSGPQAGLFGPAGGLGETWNQPSTSSASGLLDTGGIATSVGYSSTSLGGPDTWGTPTLGVLRDGLRNFNTNPGNSQQLVINGLTVGDLYDVWLASANILNTNIPNFANQRSNGEWSTPNTTTTAGPQSVDNRFAVNGSTWVEGNNYVLFEDVEADASGEIVLDGFSINGQPDFDVRLPLNGFQIREVVAATATPEPSAFALSALGLFSMGFIGWRRRRR